MVDDMTLANVGMIFLKENSWASRSTLKQQSPKSTTL